MATRKKYAVGFETKEEFDKWYDEKIDKIRDESEYQGFTEGAIWVLSYIEELLHDMFKPEAFAKADQEIRDRYIEAWRKDHKAKTLKERLDFKQIDD